MATDRAYDLAVRRRGPGSNRSARLWEPLSNHSTTPPRDSVGRTGESAHQARALERKPQRAGWRVISLFADAQRCKRFATTLMVMAITAIPKTYDSRAWRSAVVRIFLDERSVSET